jgi:hypothetical protein
LRFMEGSFTGLIPAEVQRQLALWACKTALVVDQVKGHGAVATREQLDEFFVSHEAPLPEVAVALAQFPDDRSFRLQRMWGRRSSRTTCLVGGFSVQVHLMSRTAYAAPHPDVVAFYDMHPRRVRRIWPIVPFQTWPPQESMSSREWDTWRNGPQTTDMPNVWVPPQGPTYRADLGS